MSTRRSCGSSPLTRGAQLRRQERPRLIRLIPAHAGSTRSLRVGSRMRRAHPRARGEHMAGPAGCHLGHGSSPLTRGARRLRIRQGRLLGLIPAHAGSTGSDAGRSAGIGAHPRSRGEHVTLLLPRFLLPGSSPLTRGARFQLASRAPVGGLIPAHAGSTWTQRAKHQHDTAHPRSRGEHKSHPGGGG